MSDNSRRQSSTNTSVRRPAKLHRFLVDQLEALIELLEDTLRDERTRLERAFHLLVLCNLAEFLIGLVRMLCALTHVTQKGYEEFLFMVDAI